MGRSLASLIAVGSILVATLLSANAQQSVPTTKEGVPEDIAQYRSWTKMNTNLLADPSNPRAGPKNTFVNLSPDALREIIGPGGRVRKPFPDGTIVVRESLDVDAGFVRVLFIQRKDSSVKQTKGWIFSGFTRSAANDPYQPLPVADPVARCLNCHEQMRATDMVFTPYTNRSNPLPARTPGGDRVEIFNYQFGPQVLRVKVDSTVTWANYDSVVHDIKAANRTFESGNVPLLGRYFVTFDRPGTFDYFCSVHLEMRGRIVVEP